MTMPASSLRISTARLLLRPVEEADSEPTAALVTQDISQNLSTWQFPMSAAQALEKIRHSRRMAETREAVDFAIVERGSGSLAGWIGLKLEQDVARLGYWIGAEYRGQGLTTEAARAVLPAAGLFLGTSNIRALVLPSNAPSIALLKRLGFALSGEESVYIQTRQSSETCLKFEFSFEQQLYRQA